MKTIEVPDGMVLCGKCLKPFEKRTTDNDLIDHLCTDCLGKAVHNFANALYKLGVSLAKACASMGAMHKAAQEKSMEKSQDDNQT